MLLHGSPREVSVKVLSSRFNTSYHLVVVSANSNQYSKFSSVIGGWYVLVKWVGIFGGYSKLWDSFGGCI